MVVILESNLAISSKVEQSISNNQAILLPGIYPENLSLSSSLEDGQDLKRQNKTKQKGINKLTRVQRVWKTEQFGSEPYVCKHRETGSEMFTGTCIYNSKNLTVRE